MTQKKTSIRPVGHKVLVPFDELERVSDGGIILAHFNERLAQQNKQLATIVDAGRDAWRAFRKHWWIFTLPGKPWAKPGDWVFVHKYAGQFIEDPVTGENNLGLLNDDDILAVVDKNRVTAEDYERKESEFARTEN
jgi:co-chaperonin GroES (HSP10)